MAVDYSAMRFPKGKVKALDKADKQKALKAKDKAENAKAKERANGRCEVWIIAPRPYAGSDTLTGKLVTGEYYVDNRCGRKDTETHHLKGGIGRRNRGDSILASQKLRVCASCHAAITANVLKPTTAEHDASTVRYWRAT